VTAFGAAAAALLKYRSLSLTGDEHVNCGDDAALQFDRTDPFSLSIWVRLPASGFAYLLKKSPVFGVYPERGYAMWASAGTFALSLFDKANDSSTNLLSVATDDTSFGDDRWHHVVGTYDGSSDLAGLLVYVDGALQATHQQGGVTTLTGTTVTTGDLTLGGDQATGGFAAARLMHDAAIYDKVLSLGEVQALYNSRCPPDLSEVGPFADLVGYWLLGSHEGDTDLTSFGAAYPSIPAVVGPTGTLTNTESTDVVTRA
jgi:hypothetical protein